MIETCGGIKWLHLLQWDNAKRKPLTGNPYKWFDDEEAVRSLLYFTAK